MGPRCCPSARSGKDNCSDGTLRDTVSFSRPFVRVADTAYRGLDTCFSQAFRVAYRQVLHTSVAVVHEMLAVGASVESLFQCIEGQVATQ